MGSNPSRRANEIKDLEAKMGGLRAALCFSPVRSRYAAKRSQSPQGIDGSLLPSLVDMASRASYTGVNAVARCAQQKQQPAESASRLCSRGEVFAGWWGYLDPLIPIWDQIGADGLARPKGHGPDDRPHRNTFSRSVPEPCPDFPLRLPRPRQLPPRLLCAASYPSKPSVS